MALSAYQLWQHKRKGKQYCQAWIMRDNEIIGSVNEAFNTKTFKWNDRAFMRKEKADLVWGMRDIYIYEYDNTLGKDLTVNVKDCDGHDGKKTMGSVIDPSWVSRYIGNNVVEQAISGMTEKVSKTNIISILMIVFVLLIVLYVFLG